MLQRRLIRVLVPYSRTTGASAHAQKVVSPGPASINDLRAAQVAARRHSETAMPPLAQFLVWIVMDLVGGSLAALIITREHKEGST